jgi:hypothetical protein
LKMAGKIFINYRRGDDPGATGRLFDRMQEAFEPQQLFLDVDNIAPGLDFVRELNERVAECDVLLAVIGKSWIDMRDQTGIRRLDDPNDFVRIEIESALNQGKRVIPVLVGDAHMPRPDELPETLRPLARRNAVRLTHERFRADTQGLVKALQQALEEIEAPRPTQADAASGTKTKEERGHSRRLDPQQGWRPSRLAIAIASGVVLGGVLVGALIFWVERRPSVPFPQLPTAMTSPSWQAPQQQPAPYRPALQTMQPPPASNQSPPQPTQQPPATDQPPQSTTQPPPASNRPSPQAAQPALAPEQPSALKTDPTANSPSAIKSCFVFNGKRVCD